WLLDTQTDRWRHLPGMPARLVPKATDVEGTPDGRVGVLSGGAAGRGGDGARLAPRRDDHGDDADAERTPVREPVHRLVIPAESSTAARRSPTRGGPPPLEAALRPLD